MMAYKVYMKETEQVIEINESLFAHHHNDHFLSGSFGLQGQRFLDTIAYLNHYVNSLNKEGVPESVIQLLHSLEQLAQNEKKIVELQGSKTPVGLNTFCQQIQLNIQALKPHDYLLLPGGWVCFERGGHAMIYQFMKDAKGDLLFFINNSGSGLDYHAKKSGHDKEFYNPVLTYKIPKEKIEDKNLVDFIAALLIPQIRSLHHLDNGVDKMGADYLYKTVFSKIHFVNGQLITSTKADPDYWHTAGQMSGTCTQHSLHQMLKSRFSNLDEYRRFIYGFKRRSLDEYVSLLKRDNTFTDVKYQSQVKKAIHHILRLLLATQESDATRSVFSSEEQKEGRDKLTAYLTELRESVALKPTGCIDDLQSKIALPYLLHFPNFLPVISETISEYQEVDTALPLAIHGHDHLLTELDCVMDRCLILENTKQDHALREQIEHLFLTFPLPEHRIDDPLLSFYRAIHSDEQALTFINQISQFQTMYFNACARLLSNETVLPRIYTIQQIICTIVAHANIHLPSFAQTDSLMSLFFTNISSFIDPYVANDNFHYDSRLKHILACAEERYTRSFRHGYNGQEGIIEDYKRLLLSAPDLVFELRQKYNALYLNDASDLHRSVRACQCEALFYVTTHRETLKEEDHFLPIIKKLELHEKIEFVMGFYYGKCVIKKKIVKQYTGGLAFNTPEYDIDRNPNFWKKITLSKYTQISPAVRVALMPRGVCDNQTQLLPSVVLGDSSLSQEKLLIHCQHVIHHCDLENRELVHLRSYYSPGQIELTLDYFNLHLDKLSRHEMQVYLEANLFQPGLLIAQLQGNSPNFFQQFDRLIENGLAFYERGGRLTLASVSFIRLAYLVNQYASQFDTNLFRARLEIFYHQLKTWSESPQDVAVKASLKLYRFLIVVNNLLEKNNELDDFHELLRLYFYIQSHHNQHEQLDKDTLFNIESTKNAFIRILNEHKKEITPDILLSFFVEGGLSIEIQHPHVDGSYPLFQIKNEAGELCYTINVERGLIFKDGMAFTATPLSILNHPVVKQLNLQRMDSCFASENGKLFLFDTPSSSIRFIKEHIRYRIQKQWVDEKNTLKWYQLTATSKIQAEILQCLPDIEGLEQKIRELEDQEEQLFNNFSDDALIHVQADEIYEQIENIQKQIKEKIVVLSCRFVPKIITERDTLAWVGEQSDEILLTNHKNEPWYRARIMDKEEGGWTLIAADDYGQLSNTFDIQQQCEAFENSSFVIINQYKEEERVLLPRYDLEFVVPKTNPVLHFYHDGHQYQLNQQAKSLGKSIAHLGFLCSKSKKELCIVPIQRFISKEQREEEGEYYQLEHDIRAEIAQKEIESINKSERQNILTLWQYSGAERYMIFELKSGHPVPQTPAQALYLCYLYLGSNQSLNAWNVLVDCQKRMGGLTGIYDEVLYLSWICKALPVFFDKNKENTAKISSPPFVACKLKALALLAQCSKQGKFIDFPQPITLTKNVNDLYKNKTINDVRSFYNEYYVEIYCLFTQLQAMRRSLSIDYSLSDEECKNLLDDYHEHLPGQADTQKAMGALGYEWVSLHFKALQKEQAYLLAKEKTSMLTDYDRSRKTEIDTFIRDHRGVASVSSRLEYRPIDLQLTGNVSMDLLRATSIEMMSTIRRSEEALKQFKKSSPEKKEWAVKMLVMTISENSFLEIFPCLLSIAYDPLDSKQAELMQFCKSVLIVNRHIKIEQQQSKMPLLCNVLYRILCSEKLVAHSFSNYNGLIQYAKALHANEILVPQLVDDTSGLLISATALWESLPQCIETKSPIIDSFEKIRINLSPDMMNAQQTWRTLEEKFRTGNDECALAPQEELSMLSLQEYQAGVIKYNAMSELTALAHSLFNESSTREALAIVVNEQLSQLLGDQDASTHTLLVLGNQGPDSPDSKRLYGIELEAQLRLPMNLPRLLTLYFHADVVRYQFETGLSIEKINTLHAMLAIFIDRGQVIQQLERIQSKLISVQKTIDDSLKQQALFQLGTILFAENHVDVITEPQLSLFQYYENKWLYPQQKSAMKRLLTITFNEADKERYKDVVEKMIMGGGKSKIILPTIAQQKATGSNLVIIEVPRSLLRTNYTDLNAVSSKLYNQTAVLFEFNRHTGCSSKQLKNLFEQLTDVIINKNYLITTGDALQSVELKYLELLSTRPQSNYLSEWRNQVYWANKLVLLFKHRGDLIIDEVHQGLMLKNKLNYTLGDPGTVPSNLLQDTLKLYQFFKHVTLFDVADLENNQVMTLHDVLHNNQLLFHIKHYQQACQALAKALITHPFSPLRRVIDAMKQDYGADIVVQLEHYLQNKTEHIPGCVNDASPEIKDCFALYKEEIMHLLPTTLMRNHSEHYGPSKNPDVIASIRALAIPYLANNVPNERSRFGNELESMNYTIQSLLITGVSKDLLRLFLERLQAQAQQELLEGDLKNPPKNEAIELFKRLMGPDSPSLMKHDLEDDAVLTHLHSRLSKNEDLIYEVLITQVLGSIRTDSQILHNDAYNHVDIVRSCQGMTGTPWNHTTFHQRLIYDAQTARGTDGYVLCAIKEKKPAILANDFMNPRDAINKLLSKSSESPLRSIIDVCALFKGVNNLRVAHLIGEYLLTHSSQFSIPEPIQYILYFNEQDELSAIPVRAPIHLEQSIIIGSSDERAINDRLDCLAAARFTYYDQAHTVGTDITQTQQAKALVMIDHDTPISSFLQGAMRMRGLLDGKQSIDIIVPNTLAGQSIDTLSAMMIKREHEQLMHDNFFAARGKMHNLIRADLLQQILTVDGNDAEKRKQKLFFMFKSFFIEEKKTNFYEVYGALHKEVNTPEILEDYEKYLLNKWESLLKSSQLTPSTSRLKYMNEQMKALVQQVMQPGMTHELQLSQTMELGTTVEVQKEVQVEVFIEKEVLNEVFDASRKPLEYLDWGGYWTVNLDHYKKVDIQGLLNAEPLSNSFKSHLKHLNAQSLHDICKSTLPSPRYLPDFNDNILVTKNFYQVYHYQQNFLGWFIKPVHAVLFQKIEQTLMCVLITQKELAELTPFIQSQFNKTAWISTTQHTVLIGTPPENFQQDEQYQLMIEQIRYFNGEFPLLLKPGVKFKWLNDKFKEKLDFFEEYLLPGHEAFPTDINRVRECISRQQSAVAETSDLSIPEEDDVIRLVVEERAEDKLIQDVVDKNLESEQTYKTIVCNPETNDDMSESDAATSFKKLKAQYKAFSLSDKKEPGPNSNKKA